MGKGIALEFKKRYPEMFKDYVNRCQRKDVRLGKPYLYKSLALPWVINFPTKEHWRSTSAIEDIIKGLEYIIRHYKEWGVKSLAVPPLGCGQGKLDWETVGPVLYRYLGQLDIPIELYAPYDTPQEKMDMDFLVSRAKEGVCLENKPGARPLKAAWIALVEVVRRVEQEPYHWAIGRTIFQKIAYVATQEGIPTGLHYKRGSYGPFSAEIKELITNLANAGLIREERLGRMFCVKVGPAFEDYRTKHSGEIRQWESTITKVADLFMRMHTRRSEVVATILFAARALSDEVRGKPRESEVLQHVMKWKQRRRPPLDEGEVAYTIRSLAALGWLDLKPSPDLPIPELVDV
jgi:uncharacterized protein YwgA